MSYILDALNRSEQERQQGQVPGFIDQNAILYAQKRKQPKWLLWLALIVIINVCVWFVVYQGNTTFSGSAEQAVSATPDSIAPTTSALSQGDRLHTSMVTHSESTTVAMSPSSSSVSPSPSPSPSPSLTASREQAAALPQVVIAQPTLPKLPELPQRHAFATGEHRQADAIAMKSAEPEPVLATSSELRVSNETIHEQAGIAGAGSQEQYESDASMIRLAEGGTLITPKNREAVIDGNVNALPAQPQGSVVIASAPISLDASANAAEKPSSVYEGVQMLSELDGGFQRGIPKLVFNSHIYSDNPDARRVMINNIYLREGQSFSGLQVKEIGEHDIVFEKRGQLFKLPVMRDWLG